jgi:hypothetical protein
LGRRGRGKAVGEAEPTEPFQLSTANGFHVSGTALRRCVPRSGAADPFEYGFFGFNGEGSGEGSPKRDEGSSALRFDPKARTTFVVTDPNEILQALGAPPGIRSHDADVIGAYRGPTRQGSELSRRIRPPPLGRR